MDQLKLRTLVFEKTGVKIDVDDPVFALVALNEAVLAEAVERHVALLDEATAVLAEQAQALQAAASVCGYNGAVRPAAPAAAMAHATAASGDQRAIAFAAGAAVLGALLVLLGQAMFFTIPPAPASTVIAKELTPEQAQAIRTGEKMAKIVQKLDPKTRNAIQAEMQKP
ncbi:MAG: hypothetical protein H7176_02300 [Bdellovibrionales bacterium]|nr:hypothetical protein [Massilia sp.]